MVTRDARLKEVGCCYGETPLIRPDRPKFFDWVIFKYWFVGCDLININVWRNKKRFLGMLVLNAIRAALFGVFGGVLFWGMPVCLYTRFKHITFHYPWPIVWVDALYFGIMGYFISVILVYIALIKESPEQNTFTSPTIEGDYFPTIIDEYIQELDEMDTTMPMEGAPSDVGENKIRDIDSENLLNAMK